MFGTHTFCRSKQANQNLCFFLENLAPIMCEPLMFHTYNTRNPRINRERGEEEDNFVLHLKYEKDTKLGTPRVLFIV